jgi:hypothetical protein
MDALAWTASAEVEQLRAETARSSAPGIATPGAWRSSSTLTR